MQPADLFEHLLAASGAPDAISYAQSRPQGLGCCAAVSSVSILLRNRKISEAGACMALGPACSLPGNRQEALDSALAAACSIPSPEYARAALALGACPDARDIMGLTPLMRACCPSCDPAPPEQLAVLALLLENGADPRLESGALPHALAFAFMQRCAPAAAALASSGFFGPADCLGLAGMEPSNPCSAVLLALAERSAVGSALPAPGRKPGPKGL